jgi:hypothetical protein
VEHALQDLVDWKCFACGRLNEHGLKVKSTWEGEELTLAHRQRRLEIREPIDFTYGTKSL